MSWPKGHTFPWLRKWVTSILLRVPAMAQSPCWASHSWLGHHLCRAIYVLSASGAPQACTRAGDSGSDGTYQWPWQSVPPHTNLTFQGTCWTLSLRTTQGGQKYRAHTLTPSVRGQTQVHILNQNFTISQNIWGQSEFKKPVPQYMYPRKWQAQNPNMIYTHTEIKDPKPKCNLYTLSNQGPRKH